MELHHPTCQVNYNRVTNSTELFIGASLVSEFYVLAALCFCCDFVVYSMTPSFVLGGMYSVGC